MTKVIRGSSYFFLLVLLAVFLAPQAMASTWNRETIVTFNEPVEVPGTVLSPGTYVFRLADMGIDRNVVQIFNAKENHLYATELAIPAYREKPADRIIFKFEERPKGSPEAVWKWFYPGDTDGLEFVYPKSRAMELAKASNQNVVSMPSNLAANVLQPTTSMNQSQVQALKQAPLTKVTPEQKEIQIAQNLPTAAAKPQPAATTAKTDKAADPKPAKSKAAKRLPQTASTLPDLAMIGLVALGGGLCALYFVKRVS